MLESPLPPPPPPAPRPWWDKRPPRHHAPPVPTVAALSPTNPPPTTGSPTAVPTTAPWDQPAGPPAPPPPPPPPPGERAMVPRWGLGDVAITFGVWLGINIIGGVAVVLALGLDADQLEDPSVGLTLALVLITWIGFLVWPLVAMVTKGSGRPDRDFGLAVKPIDAAWGLGGFAAFWAFNLAATLVFTLVAEGDPPTNTDLVDPATTSTGALIVLFIAVGLITPVVEELVFRGFLLRAVGKRFGAPIAIVASAVPFGLLHAQGEGLGDLWIVGLLTVYGVILAVLTVRTQRLGAAILCHALNNSLAVLIVGLG